MCTNLAVFVYQPSGRAAGGPPVAACTQVSTLLLPQPAAAGCRTSSCPACARRGFGAAVGCCGNPGRRLTPAGQCWTASIGMAQKTQRPTISLTTLMAGLAVLSAPFSVGATRWGGGNPPSPSKNESGHRYLPNWFVVGRQAFDPVLSPPPSGSRPCTCTSAPPGASLHHLSTFGCGMNPPSTWSFDRIAPSLSRPTHQRSLSSKPSCPTAPLSCSGATRSA